MVERLRAKPGGDQINVTIGDMSIAATGRHSPEELKAMKDGLERLKQQGVEPID